MNLPTKEELEHAAADLNWLRREENAKTESMLRAIARKELVVCQPVVRMADNGMLVGRYEPIQEQPECSTNSDSPSTK